ncbi:MAG: DoxX family membrane protein [Bacteroidota bacterium]|nr:DoxX family membrane protein [Bacteroidota bacterium]
MAPLFILLVVFLATLLYGKIQNKKTISVALAGRMAMFAMLLFTGTSHFYFSKGMVLTMPDFLPAKLELVYATGILEILLGIGLLIERTRKISSLLLILFLITVLPANIVAAMKHVDIPNADFTGPGLSYLWFRIPLQLFFIGWVYVFGYRSISRFVNLHEINKFPAFHH